VLGLVKELVESLLSHCLVGSCAHLDWYTTNDDSGRRLTGSRRRVGRSQQVIGKVEPCTGKRAKLSSGVKLQAS